MRSSASGVFSQTFSLVFRQRNLVVLRGDPRWENWDGEFICKWCWEALNTGKETDGKKLFCGGTEQYIFSSQIRVLSAAVCILHVIVSDRSQNE